MPQEDRAQMIREKHDHLSVLKETRKVLLYQLEVLEENLEAYVAAEKAGIRELFVSIENLDKTIEQEATALYHLQSASTGRPAPKPSSASSPAAASSPAPPAGAPAQTRAPAPAAAPPSPRTVKEIATAPFSEEEAAYWRDRAKRGEAGTMKDVAVTDDGKQKIVDRPIGEKDIPDPARIADGFDVELPPHTMTLEGVKATKKVRQWEMEVDPDFSAQDEVDKFGYRWVVRGKRHPDRIRIFDQLNRCVYDGAIEDEAKLEAFLETLEQGRASSSSSTPPDTEPPPAPSSHETANGATIETPQQ